MEHLTYNLLSIYQSTFIYTGFYNNPTVTSAFAINQEDNLTRITHTVKTRKRYIKLLHNTTRYEMPFEKDLVLSLDLKRPRSPMMPISGRSLFQSLGAATEKASQHLHLDLGASKKSWLDLFSLLRKK